jgi:hypothetical protein
MNMRMMVLWNVPSVTLVAMHQVLKKRVASIFKAGSGSRRFLGKTDTLLTNRIIS